MAQKKAQRIRIDLDRVERDLVFKVKAMRPEYAGMEPYQIAKMELRYRLFEELRRAKTGKDLNTSGQDRAKEKALELTRVSAASWASQGFLDFPNWDFEKCEAVIRP